MGDETDIAYTGGDHQSPAPAHVNAPVDTPRITAVTIDGISAKAAMTITSIVVFVIAVAIGLLIRFGLPHMRNYLN